MKILVITDVHPDLSADLLCQLQAAVRRVQINDNGDLINRLKTRGGKIKPVQPAEDWRPVYEKYLQRLFPNAWIYRGGHHLAIHASPPTEPHHINRHQVDPGGEAGRILFHIVESQPTVPKQPEPIPNPQPKVNQTMQ